MSIARLLIIFGLVLFAAGLLWPLIVKLGLGRLPGDRISTLLADRNLSAISAILSLILWLTKSLTGSSSTGCHVRFTPKADILQGGICVRFVPQADVIG